MSPTVASCMDVTRENLSSQQVTSFLRLQTQGLCQLGLGKVGQTNTSWRGKSCRVYLEVSVIHSVIDNLTSVEDDFGIISIAFYV